MVRQGSERTKSKISVSSYSEHIESCDETLTVLFLSRYESWRARFDSVVWSLKDDRVRDRTLTIDSQLIDIAHRGNSLFSR